ncbi:MAG: thiolase family protein [Pseudomonadota bacterium]
MTQYNNEDIVFISALRTPIGKTGGFLAKYPAPKLAGFVISEILNNTKIDPAKIDELIIGNVLTAGEKQHPGRQVAIASGLPNTPSFTIGKNCGSGLKAVALAVNCIKSNDKEIIIAGGMESLSNVPDLFVDEETFNKADKCLQKDPQVLDFVTSDASFCPISNKHIIYHAENSAGKHAKKYNLDPEEFKKQIDMAAFESHEKANASYDKGAFKNEVVRIDEFDKDELPRIITFERINKKRNTRYNPEGMFVSPYNSPMFADASACFLLMKYEKAISLGLKPIAKVIGYADGSAPVADFLIAPIDAVNKLLAKINHKIQDFDLIESNASFGVQTLILAKELNYDLKKVNVKGDCVAQGHPIGAAGAVRLVTLIHALKDRNLKKGLVSICLGGGDAIAMAVEVSGKS